MSADEDNMTAWRKIGFLISGEEFYENIKTKEAGTEVECPECGGTGFPKVRQPDQPGRKIYPKDAMDAAVATLQDPVSSAHVNSIAETILRSAKEGERDPATLGRMALLELQITPRD
jgi:hypothetical protein